jgi:hypothetical protein
VFVTADAALVIADFGGLADADALCAAQAENAGLAGTFVAILVSSSTDLEDRLEIRGPIFNTIGEMLAAGPEDFADGDLLGPNLIDAGGNEVTSNLQAWFGDANLNCADWTSGSPDVEGVVADLSKTGWSRPVVGIECAARVHLQCISQ